MAAKYRKIDPRTWDDEVFDTLDMPQALVAIWLMTTKNVNRAGVATFTLGELCDKCRIQGVQQGVDTLSSVCDRFSWPMQKVGRTTYVVIFLSWFKHNGPSNDDHLKGMLSDLDDVPRCDVITQEYERTKQHLDEKFHKVFDSIFTPCPTPCATPTPTGTPTSGTGTEAGALAPAKARSDPIDPPPPPPSDPSAQSGSVDSASTWGVVVEKLLEVGVAQAEPAIGIVKGNGCSPDDVLAVVEHFESCRPAWEPGALHNRLLTLRPGQDASKHWPPPSAAYQREQAQQAEQNLARKKAEQQRKLDEQRAAEELRWTVLEKRHGDALNFLDQQGVIDLLKQAEPERWDFYVKLYRKSGLTDTLRGVLIEYLEREHLESIGQSTSEGES